MESDAAALILQKYWRSLQEQRNARLLALRVAWDLLDYDEEKKGRKEEKKLDLVDKTLRSSLTAQEKVAEPEPSDHQVRKDISIHMHTSHKDASQKQHQHEEEESEDHHKKAKGKRSEGHHHHENTSKGHHHHDKKDKEKTSEVHHHGSHHHGKHKKDHEKHSHHHHHHEKKKKKASDVTYFTIELPVPLTEEVVETMMRHFKQGEVLEEEAAREIVTRFISLMETEQTTALAELHVPSDAAITVCGDTHGQLADLFTIFRLNGLPSRTNRYLFNGDFVDRGNYGMEVCLCLFAWKLVDPQCLHLNRGNHESRRMNEKYAFEEEVRSKYAPDMFDLIQTAFCLLPLASLIQKTVLVVHGGLFREEGITLDMIKTIDYRRQPPKHGETPFDARFEDLLWSDPRDIVGRDHSSRGAGTQFGTDVTKAFLVANNLKLIIRSHEVKPQGYELMHDHSLITVFSASNYCGTNDNFGAFVVFANGNFVSPVFHRYHADSIPNISTSFSYDILKAETLEKLRERIYSKKDKLFAKFQELEQELVRSNVNSPSAPPNGLIKKHQWHQAMNDIIGPEGIPWYVLQPYILNLEPDGLVDYRAFLARYQIPLSASLVESWQDLIIKEMCEKVYEKNKELLNIFKEIDANGDGMIDQQEFALAMKKCDIGLDTEQFIELYNCIDTNKDHFISYEEFMARFKPVYTQLQQVDAAAERWFLDALRDIGEIIFKRKSHDLDQVFKEFDKDGNGKLTYGEFSVALRKLGMPDSYRKKQRYKLAEWIDHNKNGFIEYQEFIEAFKVTDSSSASTLWRERMVERMSRALFKNRASLRRTFLFFDRDNSGKIDLEEFKIGIKALQLLEPEMTDLQMANLHSALDTNSDGFIDYEEFMRAFEVKDLAQVK
jgi:protein phosphatase